MSNRENLYKILDIDKKANNEDIKKSFRRLSLLNHPDKNENDPIKTEKFKQINRAYGILGNQEKRNQYDNEEKFPIHFEAFGGMPGMGDFMRFGAIPIFTQIHSFPNGHCEHFSRGNKSNNSMDNSRFQSHEDLINMFFGQEYVFNSKKVERKKNIEKPNAITKNLEIQIKDAFTGCTLPLEIERWIIENDTCRNEKEKIYVNIPKGIDNNELITLEGKGNIAEQNTKGDIKIFVKINNNTEFERDGLNLIYKKQLDLKEAICGYEFNIKYIDERIFKIINKKGNDTLLMNFKKVIPQLGMEREGNRGELILEFNVNNLEQLTPDKLKQLKEIL